jgi:thiol-disulfide isomerase/thioredoxin
MPHASPCLSRGCRWSAALITSCSLLVGLAGCGKGQPKGPITAEKSGFQADDGTTPNKGPAPPDASTDPGNRKLNDQGGAKGTGPVNVSDARPSAGAAAVGPGGTAVTAPPQMPPLQTDIKGELKVPDTKEALLAFLQDLTKRQPQGADQVQLLDDFRKIQNARIAAADKLAKISADKKDRLAAAMAKAEGLLQLARTGPEYEKDLNSYCRSLVKDKEPEIARVGRLVLLKLAIADMVMRKATNIQAIADEIKSLVADGGQEPEVFEVTAQATMVMQQLGHKDQANQAYQLIGTAFKDHPNPEVAARAKELLTMAKVLELDLYAKVNAMMKGEPDGVPAVLETLKTLFSDPGPGASLLEITGQVAQAIEMSRQYAAATEAYTMIETAYKNSADKKLADDATQRAARGLRRVGLVGKPFTVAGALPDGSPFDWTKYQGKVVLIDFWATWCKPCREELPNIERAYQLYRDKGFEVVGVNLDEEPQKVEQFLAVQPLPWKTVLSADPAARGFEHPLAVQCGIDSIPFIVLVDRDGKVKDLHLRGPEIERQLAALLGPAEPTEKTPPAKPGLPPIDPEPKP